MVTHSRDDGWPFFIRLSLWCCGGGWCLFLVVASAVAHVSQVFLGFEEMAINPSSIIHS